MLNEERCIDLPMAQVVHLPNDLVEVRIRPDMRIDVPGLLASMQARRDLLQGRKGPVCFIALGDLDWEPAALQTDFFGQDAESLTAVAVLVNSKTLSLVANLYFGLFPGGFPAQVFNDEAAMRAWLDETGK